jgi:hypothetical protein
MSLPCKNVDVMSSICNLTKRFCIHCAGYEARENIPKDNPIVGENKSEFAEGKIAERKEIKGSFNKGKK